jgi:hypothetical protein
MNLSTIIFVAALFVALTPGVLLTLPKGGKKITVAVVHGVVFAIALSLINKYVTRVRIEGFQYDDTPYPLLHWSYFIGKECPLPRDRKTWPWNQKYPKLWQERVDWTGSVVDPTGEKEDFTHEQIIKEWKSGKKLLGKGKFPWNEPHFINSAQRCGNFSTAVSGPVAPSPQPIKRSSISFPPP